MKTTKPIIFGSFRFDEANQCLWRESHQIPLRPKAYSVLKYLIERAGTLVTKEQLLEGVWPDTFVSDAVLKDCIRQLREAFQDDAKSPQFIETAHRRGYRFIAPIEEQAAPRQASKEPHHVDGPSCAFATSVSTVAILDRDEALAKMAGWLESSIAGKSQLVFVTGEAGIGKTTLVEEFLRRSANLHDIWIGQGQCLEQYGAGEPYLPLLDCFSRLCRGPSREPFVEILKNNAPSWLEQMPSLLAQTEEILDRHIKPTRDSMLREMAEAIEVLTAKIPLILVLEDLHWSDYSTLDLISYLARRQYQSRLMLIGTYRPVEVTLNEHPLKDVKRELQMHKLCHELPLEYLTAHAVAEFLSLKFGAHHFPDRVASMIHQRTEGNPLFMINVIDYLVDEKIILQQDGDWILRLKLDEFELRVPENIRFLIEKHLDRLSEDEQRVLEGASVVGMDCSAVAISAGLEEDVVRIEEICDDLARQNHFLLPAYIAELPNGTLTPRYRFIHALYLDVLYSRVPATLRSQIHGRIGIRGESIYGERVGEIAAELAVHFEQARDPVRAVKYLQLAAANAVRRSAHHEVVSLARRGLALLKTYPNITDRAEQELALLNQLSRFGAVEPET